MKAQNRIASAGRADHDLDGNWSLFIQKLGKSLDESEIEAWVRNIRLDSFSRNKVVIGGFNRFFQDWVSKEHWTLFQHCLLESFKDKGLSEDFELQLKVQKPNEKKTARTKTFANPSSGNGLSRFNRFENFVNGANTDIAYAAALSISENVGKSKYNPLFLCGDVGLGKTHLMQAVGLKALEANPGVNVYYCSSEHFTNEVIEGIRFQKIHESRKKYRSLDLLMIDDIQFLENKESTQTEFFHTFNELILSGKQIVMTSDRYPREMEKIQERLVNRFAGGLIAKIEPPDYETRAAIIKSLVEQMDFDLSEELVFHIAHAIRSNVRDIKSVLLMLEGESSLLRQEITIDSARSILKEVLNLDRSPKSVDEIIKTTANKLKVKISDILSDSREREISNARQICMYITREITDLSYPAIGKHFEKNHTTVLQACKRIRNTMDENAEMKQLVLSLVRENSL